jgi:hypothetical protein
MFPRTPAFTQIDLDIAAANGCMVPGCDHTQHSDTIIFRGKCHQDNSSVSVIAYRFAGKPIMRIACGTCDRTILDVALTAVPQPVSAHDTDACRGYIEAGYTRGSGLLTIRCWKCEETLAEIPVLPAHDVHPRKPKP